MQHGLWENFIPARGESTHRLFRKILGKGLEAVGPLGISPDLPSTVSLAFPSNGSLLSYSPQQLSSSSALHWPPVSLHTPLSP